jgi:glyoxylase-like metal-dependent hydrolase (beta-lactamase superfamily II)
VITGTAQYDAWQRRVLPPVEQVRPGLWSIPVPIPHNPLRYTLCYAFAGETQVVLVDPGWDTTDGRNAVKTGLAAGGADLTDVAGVVVTHVHPDHHGLSGWLRRMSGAWIGMHAAEAETLPGRIWRGRAPGTDRAWLRRNGVPEADVAHLAVDPDRLAGLLEMAEPDRLIADGERLALPGPARLARPSGLSGREVRAVWTPGHTPGHLCLHDAEAGVLLTGDHLLPRISPNIGSHGDGDEDPLGAYLSCLERTSAFAADEALPAHEYRFRAIDVRAAELIAHHDERGAEILRVADRLPEPSAWAIAAALTWSRGWDALHGMMRRMALAETVAHLSHLAALGAVTVTPGTPMLWRVPGRDGGDARG